jgi:hypothetical protein
MAVPGAVVLAVLVVVALLARPLPPVRAEAPGSFSFAVLGDAPYSSTDKRQYPLVMQDLNAHQLALIIHVGDIMAEHCTDARYQRTLEWWSVLRHPLVYTPGDNEWTDCRDPFAPLERLAHLRRMFFPDPARSLGGRPLPLVSQAANPAFAEFVENARWSHQGIVFVTVHVVGSSNGRVAFPGRTAADDQAVIRRTEAAAAWLRDSFAEATARRAPAVVVAFQAFPFFERAAADPRRRNFEPFILTLEEEVERFGGPVLAVHGDYHEYLVDQPLVRRTTGRRLANFTRLQVPGSPRVGWVRVVATLGAPPSFRFESRVVSRWRFW